jgi:nanoRNase/pAp phosphatase (c-di-AMP/oligoRNAs hydrolase)
VLRVAPSRARLGELTSRLSVIEAWAPLDEQRGRVTLYRDHAVEAEAQLLASSTVHGNLVVLDLREQEVIHPTNRFMIYALHPRCNVSIHVLWGSKKQNTVFAMGKSIVDRSSRNDVGALMLSYGGGGHEAAGTCQVENADADRVLGELAERVAADG